MKATVTSANGQPVNMRATPNKAGRLITKIAVGETVDVNMEGNEWTLISYRGQTGYMMTTFLHFESDGYDDGNDMIMVERSVLQDIYDKIDMLLHG